MTKPIRGLGNIGSGVESDIGLSIMQLGMITGLHAAISPSLFTFACFAKKPEECKIARRTLWVSLLATTLTNVGVLFAFGRWAPAIAGQITGTALFALGMKAIDSAEGAPSTPSMEVTPTMENASAVENMAGIRGLGMVKSVQPDLMVGQSHWLDRDYPDVYARWWEGPAPMR